MRLIYGHINDLYDCDPHVETGLRKFVGWISRDSGPGYWYRIQNLLPSHGGSYFPPNLLSAGLSVSALTSPGTMLRAWCALRADDIAVGYMGTTTKIWQHDGDVTFTDRSKAGGYTSSAADWSFAQYGNITIATNRVDAVQSRDATGSSAFADLAGSPPKARIVVTQAEQVVLFDLNDGAEKPNAFAACAPGDHTDWSGAGATTATQIRHRPGKITAAIAFRNYILVFKRSSIYKLTYTGSSTFKWHVDLIAVGRGVNGKHDVVNCGDTVVFTGRGGAWSFDGASFTSLTEGQTYAPLNAGTSAASVFSPDTGLVYFVTNSLFVIAYNVSSDAWGEAFVYGASGVTITINIKLLTGEPAAIAAFTQVVPAFPDLQWWYDVANGTQIFKSTMPWGGGVVSGTSNEAWAVGTIEGQGGDLQTSFKRLIPSWSNTALSAPVGGTSSRGARSGSRWLQPQDGISS
jgi:hypothetical protein